MNYADEQDLGRLIKNALKEDIGRRDVTSETVIPPYAKAKAILLAKEDCVICGLAVASLVFKTFDKNIKFTPLAKDGFFLKKNSVISKISGRARSILAAERVALNFLSLLSGISTTTRRFVDAVRPYKAKILDTRKTIPGLRLLEKYAVRTGGGYNHRLSLDEMVLIKDNHIKVVRGSQRLSEALRGCSFEIEVKNLKELRQALRLKPDIIMLDNMSLKDIRKAVSLRNSLHHSAFSIQPKIEASGGVTLKTVKKIASCGVDMISVGALTHSVNSVDISLEIV